MTFAVFRELSDLAGSSQDYAEYIKKASEIKGFDDSLVESKVVSYIWSCRNDKSLELLRYCVRMNKVQFCKAYGVSTSAMAGWEHGRTTPSKTTARLLSFAVMNDIQQKYLEQKYLGKED